MALARWLITPAAVVALAACGSSTNSSTVPPDSTAAPATVGPSSSVAATRAPTVIHLSATGASAESASGGATPVDQGNGADGQVEPMPIRPVIVTYVTTGDLPALGGTGQSWKLSSGAQPDPARIKRVAAALGVQGTATKLPADQGGGWIVGSPTTGPTVQVNADGLLSWWYNPVATAPPEPPAKDQAGSEGAPAPAGSIGGAATRSGGSGGSPASGGPAPHPPPPPNGATKGGATPHAPPPPPAPGARPAPHQ